MALLDLQLDHDHLLHQAAQLIECDVRAVRIESELEQLLLKQLIAGTRRGVESEHPILFLHPGHTGHSLIYGLETYYLTHGDERISLVRVVAPIAHPMAEAMYDFWAVPVNHVKSLHRFLRTLRRTIAAPEPLLEEVEKSKLFRNTIHFLQQGAELLSSYGIRPQRGVLLVGEPGNGKTMACRWLAAECRKVGLSWRTVASDEFQIALGRRRGQQLFELPTPGVILFDDFDICVRDERRKQRSYDQLLFLSQLDGMRLPSPTVFLFTSNARPEEFDAAFLRPGRIDQVIQFQKPSTDLRRRLITERWSPEILQAIDIGQVIELTADLSFAELEELKRQLVFGYLDEGIWDWDRAWRSFGARQQSLSSDSRRESSDC